MRARGAAGTRPRDFHGKVIKHPVAGDLHLPAAPPALPAPAGAPQAARSSWKGSQTQEGAAMPPDVRSLSLGSPSRPAR